MATNSTSLPERAEYRIVDDSPGRRLELIWQGAAPRAALRWIGLLVILAILIGTGVFSYTLALPAIQQQIQNPSGGPDGLGMAVISGVIIASALVLVVWIVRAGGDYTKYISRVAWDSVEGQFVLSYSGGLLFGKRRLRIPLDQILSLQMTVGSETSRAGLPIQLTITYRQQGGVMDFLKLTLPLEPIDRRSEAMDFLFRLGRVGGHTKYQVQRSDPRELRVELLRDQQQAAVDEDFEDDDDFDEDDSDDDELHDDAEGRVKEPVVSTPQRQSLEVLPIPADWSPADYESGAAPSGFVEPKILVPSLDRKKLETESAPSHLALWDPPHMARLTRDPMPRAALVVVAVLMAIVGAVLGAWPLHGIAGMIAHPPSAYETGAFGALIATLLGTFLVWAFNRQRDVAIDTASGEILCRHGEQLRHYALSDVCEVALIGERTTHSKDDTQTDVYRCRIELGVGAEGEWAFDSGEWSQSREEPYRKLLPLSIELARMLGVPWRWQEYGEGASGTWFRQLGWKERTVVVTLLLSVVGYLVSLRGGEVQVNATVEAVRATGTDISFLNKFSMKEFTVLEDYWKVEFNRANFDNARLARVAPLLPALGRAGLYLSDTSLDDSGLRLLSGSDKLLLLEMYSTRITSDGMEALTGLDSLEFLAMSNTRIDDAGLERLPPMPNLRFLMLATTQVTDKGLPQVLKYPSLEYVGLQNLTLSNEAVERLQQARPKLTIAR